MGRLLRRLAVVLFVLIVVAGVFMAVTVAPVNRVVKPGAPWQVQTMQYIDSVLSAPLPADTHRLMAGFGKASITPSRPVATAGYVKRKGARFTAVRDTVFVRAAVIEKGGRRTAIVSLDMLIVPPLLVEKLNEALHNTPFTPNMLYLSATHTHNSIGQWDNHLVGEIYAGKYDKELVGFLLKQIKTALLSALADVQPVALYYGQTAVSEAVVNRLVAGGAVDSLMHALQFACADGSRAVVVSYPAHATCLSSKDLRLSADYPGELVTRLERGGYRFALFLAGAVGSHAPAPMPDGDAKIEFMAATLEKALHTTRFSPVQGSDLRLTHIPVAMPPQQVRLTAGWRIRPWLSEMLLGKSPVKLSVLQLGNTVFVGTPCDFSGMLTPPLYAAARQHSLNICVTSFNGGYIGYITPDELYDMNAYETQIMNWYGPGNGAYLSGCIKNIISQTAQAGAY
ncbi:MAG: hypothetical protein KatS3mg032_1172 [Cyclobacteriaceae bacterium]|nr:MAG: hypothetical protein KatS3mg032_1172 [Cyclobacteriaceae bacterium]